MNTRTLFYLSLSILALAAVWVLKVRHDIYEKISLPAQEVIKGEIPERYTLLKSYKEGNAAVISLYDRTRALSYSLIFLGQPASSRTEASSNLPSLENLLSAVKEYRATRQVRTGYNDFLIKYLAAHIDARRIALREETTLESKHNKIPVLTFQLKDENFYGLAYVGNARSYILASSAGRVVSATDITSLVNDIPAYR